MTREQDGTEPLNRLGKFACLLIIYGIIIVAIALGAAVRRHTLQLTYTPVTATVTWYGTMCEMRHFARKIHGRRSLADVIPCNEVDAFKAARKDDWEVKPAEYARISFFSANGLVETSLHGSNLAATERMIGSKVSLSHSRHRPTKVVPRYKLNNAVLTVIWLIIGSMVGFWGYKLLRKSRRKLL
jgi:hypothetical protein